MASYVDDPSGWGMDSLPVIPAESNLPIDQAEAVVMDAYTPVASSTDQRPWYARAVELGISGAIDVLSGSTPRASGSYAPTYAGQNGRTYVNPASANGVIGAPNSGNSMLGIVALVGLALLVAN